MADPVVSLQYNDSDVRKRFEELTQRVQDVRPALKNVREIILLDLDNRFEQEVSPEGVPWKPNSTRTQAIKRAQKRIMKINQSTGRMRASINGQVIGDKLVIGTNVGYAADRQKENPFLGISKEVQKEIISEFDRHINTPK